MGESSSTKPSLAEKISESTSGFIQDKHRDLLDIVDSLRSSGVSHYVDLPQIIVCSSIAFPTAEGLCTRFATELILRRGPKGGKNELKVQIQPSAKRTEVERIKLLKFCETQSDSQSFPAIIEAAKTAMGLTGSGTGAVGFCTDVLRVESISSTAPNLTLVDLPGLFGASDKNQSDDDDATLVQNLVVSYMKQRRSIILAVVSADTAFANQPVTKFGRDIDPSGTRTLGLITKPDKIEKGSEMEAYYIELARNENVRLALGWHVLRNKSHATMNDTQEQREEREAEFFAESAWSDALKPSQLGVAALRVRLNDALYKKIHDELPGVKYEVQSGIKDCTIKLYQLGKARSTKKEKHTYLHRISGNLSIMVQAAIDGVYANPFFASFPNQQDAFARRLRANIQRILTIYAGKRCLHGHALEIVEDDLKPTRVSTSKYIMRSDYLVEVTKLMEECRGRELPGTYNPLVVADLFSRQCMPWERITQNLAEEVHEAASTTFNMMIIELCDENTRGRLMKGLVRPSLHQLRKDLKEKLDELLRPHLEIHPITYNDYLVKSVQQIQGKRHDRAFDRICMDSYEVTADKPAELEQQEVASLLQALKNGTRPDVESYSVSLAADVAAAYYKVALKKFIDDVSVNAVETCLVQRLPGVFSPEVAWDLSDQQVEHLGSEDDATVTERAELQLKLQTLEKGLKGLDGFTAQPLSQALRV